MNIGKRRDEGGVVLSSVPGVISKEAFIGGGTVIKGTLSFSGPAEVGGSIEGEILAKDRLKIVEGATVTARVSGTEIEISGTVLGDITATTRLILRKPAKITGNINAASLIIEEGVVFEGSCVMKSSPQLSVSKSGS